MKFEVTVQRESLCIDTLTVEAGSVEEANEKAEEEARNIEEFGQEIHHDYTCLSTDPVE